MKLNASSAASEPDLGIAITGMAVRFPGAEDGLDSFWRVLEAGHPTITEVSGERWSIDDFYDPDPDTVGRMSTRFGGFLNDIDLFDAGLFGISPREAAAMDPQQRLLLELAWHALEDAGSPPERLKSDRTGVFVGICGSDYARMSAIDPANLNAFWATGNVASVAAGRIAYTFGITGPCIALDTACSSALVAVHEACESIRRGECDVAIVGAVNLILAPEPSIALSKARMMSPDGRCYSFDARANGYVRSEGAAVIVLSRFSGTTQSGSIHGLIRGSAINQDGASGGLTVPNGPAQSAVIRAALARAGLSPDDIDVVETHGTGTPLGDPVEAQALAEVFGPGRDPARPLVLSAVKSVVGHTEIAAGLAGLVKMILALRHKKVPGYRELDTLNGHIDWSRLPLLIPREDWPWSSKGQPRRAGVSSFGFSGTNAHVILEESPPILEISLPEPDQPGWLLALSGRDKAALRRLALDYAALLNDPDSPSLDSVTGSANAGRATLTHRAALVAADKTTMRQALARVAQEEDSLRSGRPRSHIGGATVAFAFPGQGAQRSGMARQLYGLHEEFRRTVDRCDIGLRPSLGCSILDVMWGSHADAITQTRYAQPALFTVEFALARLWQRWGVEPTYVIGHSIGEFAAACIAGVFDLEDALSLVAARGQYMQSLPEGGAMAALRGDAEQIVARAAQWGADVAVAAINSPDQTVVSGDRLALLQFCDELANDGVSRGQQSLDVSHAFHSPLMKPMLEPFRAIAEKVNYRQAEIGFVSTVSGLLDGESCATPEYWVNQIVAPVAFSAAMTELEALGCNLLLEVGPGTTLTGLTRVGYDALTSVATFSSGQDEWTGLLRALSVLFAEGVTPDWTVAGRTQPLPPRAALPSYPFQRQRHWFAGTGGGEAHASFRHASTSAAPLLGRPVDAAIIGPNETLWEVGLGGMESAFLSDHCVFGRAVMPAAGFVETMLSAAHADQEPDASVRLTNVTIKEPLPLLADGSQRLQTHRLQEMDERQRLRVYSGDVSAGHASKWREHADCLFATPSTPAAADTDWQSHWQAADGGIESGDFYSTLAEHGLDYGPCFRSITELRLTLVDDQVHCLARIALPPKSGRAAMDYRAHPILLDGCFQSLAALFEGERTATYMPVAFEQLDWFAPLPERLNSRAVLRHTPDADNAYFIADLTLSDESGRTLMQIQGLQALPVDKAGLLLATAPWRDKLYQVDWLDVPSAPDHAETAGEAADWVIAARTMQDSARLANALAVGGQRVRCVTHAELRDSARWRALAEDTAGIGRFVFLSEKTDDERTVSRTGIDMTDDAMLLTQRLLDLPGKARLILVTNGAQATAPAETADPEQAMLWGFGRAVIQERPGLDCRLIDLGSEEIDAAALCVELFADDEPQVARRGLVRRVPRLRRNPSLRARDAGLTLPNGPWRIRASQYGSLDALTALPFGRPALAADEVEIAVEAAAVNFKDVMYTLGLLRDFSEAQGVTKAADQPLGFECAGEVVRVGDSVCHVAVGDKVFGMTSSALASHAVIKASMTHLKPPGLSAATAAALPTVFMTALYGLEQLARLQPGETVLIHAAAGGVGQAAIQVAKRVGARIFATASPAKWPTLRQQGVEVVLNSRTLDYADEISTLTDGHGVDVVLNSLNGEHIARTSALVAKGGRFIEIGKAGAWSAAQMAVHRPDIAYHLFDLGEVEDGTLQADLLTDVLSSLTAGQIDPLPVRCYPAEQAVAAFRHLAQARNIGKVVITLPAQPAAALVRSDRSYLIAGGTGALGEAIARWLADSGAGAIIVAGRTAPTGALASFVAESQNRVAFRSVDLRNAEAVSVLVAEMAQGDRPLAGVFHAAGVLSDAMIEDLDRQGLELVAAAKVMGARHLHDATVSLKLDHFVLFSSIASVLGSSGQAAYAAANGFLDGLAQQRRALGLPATVINWGPWAEIGMAARGTPATQARLSGHGLRAVDPREGIELLEVITAHAPTSVMVADIDWPRFLRRQPAGAKAMLALLDRERASGAREPGRLLRLLKEAPEDEKVTRLADHLRALISTTAGFTSTAALPDDRPLAELGLDSLMTLEIRNSLESDLCCTLDPTMLSDHPTLAKLAAHLAAIALRPNIVTTGVRAPPAQVLPTAGSGLVPLATMTERQIDFADPTLQLCAWPTESQESAFLFVHGIMDQAAVWEQVVFGLTASGWAASAVDLRGHGRSGHAPTNAQLSAFDFAADIAAAVTALGGRRVTLVGHSFGTVACALYAASHRDRVERLILIEPVVPFWREQRDPGEIISIDLHYGVAPPPHPLIPDLAIAARMLADSHPGLDRNRAEALARRSTAATADGLQWRWDPRLRNPLGINIGMSRSQYLRLLATLSDDMLVLFGTSSQFANTGVLLDPADLAQPVTTRTLTGGHNLHTEDPEGVSKVMLEWLKTKGAVA